MLNKDVLGGTLMLAIGAIVAINAFAWLQMGTVRHMGPGMVPAALGVLLLGIGALMLIGGLRAARFRPLEGEFDARAFAAVLAGLATFAVLVNPLGIVPAIIALVLVSSFADGDNRIVPMAVWALLLAAGAVVVFYVLLDIPLNLFWK